MTAVTTTRRAGSRQRGLKSLAGGLSFVCLVLFLLAIEQKQAMQAWDAVRDNAAPMAQRLADRVVEGAADGLSGLKRAADSGGRPASAGSDSAVLAGAFAPADDATRDAVGGAAFAGARIQFETGGALHTRPLRIAAGGEIFARGGETFAARLDAPRDAQIELRQVVAPGGASLCDGHVPGVVALLHRGDRVDVMIFRGQTIVGPDAPADALCGVWLFEAR